MAFRFIAYQVADSIRACLRTGLTMGALLAASTTQALDIAALLDEFDFNDFAVGLGTDVAQQPYRGVGHTQFLYPYITTIEDSTLTDDVFVARNGTYGLRTVRDSGFEIGVLGRLEMLGFGSDPEPPLTLLEPPQWTIELGPSIGWRRGPVQPDIALRKGLWGGHSGWVGEFSLSAPIETRRGYVVPYLSIAYQGDEYLDHYFGVRPRLDTAPDLPAYNAPDQATTFRAGVRGAYRLSDLWVLSGSARMDWLDDEVVDSPLVNRDTLAAFSIGIAYNRSIFEDRDPDWRGRRSQPRLELSAYSVAGSTSNDFIRRRATLGESGTDLDGVLPLDADPDFVRFDGVWRLGDNHRVEASYANIDRQRRLADGRPGNTTESLHLGQTSRFARAAYGYSLLNTAQKELGLLLGLHWPRLTASIENATGERLVEADVASPLFSVGAYGRLAMRRGFSAEARLEIGGLDVGDYEGAIVDARGVLAWKPLKRVSLLAGYSWQFTRLEGYTDNFAGRFSQRTHGPLLGLQLSL